MQCDQTAITEALIESGVFLALISQTPAHLNLEPGNNGLHPVSSAANQIATMERFGFVEAGKDELQEVRAQR